VIYYFGLLIMNFMSTFGLKAKGVDDFITDIIDLNQERAIQAFKDLVLNRTNPDLDEFQFLDRFRKIGLVDSANYIRIGYSELPYFKGCRNPGTKKEVEIYKQIQSNTFKNNRLNETKL
jgi:hypothetical protein